MTQFYTYIWTDPKTNTPIYVGKGKEDRAISHLKAKSRLGSTLRKRLREGYAVEPRIVLATDEDDAFEMETCLIALIGREDLGQGTLFNLTPGGEGCLYVRSVETRRKNSEGSKRACAREEVKVKRAIARGSAEYKTKLRESQAKANAREEVKAKRRASASRANNAPGARERMSKSVTVALSKPEIRRQMSDTARRNMNKPGAREAVSIATAAGIARRPLLTCPHCQKSSKGGNFKSWHFDNCKYKETV